MASPQDEIAEVVQRVKSWPAAMRIALARGILETLASPALPENRSGPLRGQSAEEVLALFKPVTPPPSDEECERVLEEELAKRYGL